MSTSATSTAEDPPRRLIGDNPATLCHRGILRIDDALPAMLHQPSISISPLGGGVWSADEGVYRTIFLEGRRGVVAFDTFYSPGAAVAYRKAIGRVFPEKPIHTLVYSHDHLDHTGFGLDLAPHAEVIAHADCAQVIDRRRADGQKPATEAWDGERRRFEIDGTSFELINPGPTHGDGNIAAYFPAQKLLFMVDTVIPGVGYTFLPNWHLRRYVTTMRSLEALDWETFVPGHFWPVDRRGFHENLDYYDFLLEAGRRAVEEGVDPDHYPEIARYADRRYRRSHGHLFRFAEYFPMNLMRAMVHARTGGWGLEDNQPVGGPTAFPPEPAVRPTIKVVPLARGLWSAACDDHRTVFAEASSGVVALNTFGSVAAARAYREAIESTVPGKQITAVVLTIDHLDHAGYAAELAPDAEVICHELADRVIRGRGAPQRPPSRPVTAGGETVLLDGLELELSYPGPTVGTGNLAVRFPERGVLFVIGPRADARYGLFADWHVEHYAAALRQLLRLRFDVVAPGRGEITDRDGIERAIRYFEAIQLAAQKAFAAGVAIWDRRAIDEYVTELMRGSFADLEGFADHVGIGAFRVAHHYLMGGWGVQDTPAHSPPTAAAGRRPARLDSITRTGHGRA